MASWHMGKCSSSLWFPYVAIRLVGATSGTSAQRHRDAWHARPTRNPTQRPWSQGDWPSRASSKLPSLSEKNLRTSRGTKTNMFLLIQNFWSLQMFTDWINIWQLIFISYHHTYNLLMCKTIARSWNSTFFGRSLQKRSMVCKIARWCVLTFHNAFLW